MAALLALGASTSASAQTTEEVVHEQAAAELTAAVLGGGTQEPVSDRVLGMYFDEKTAEYVVVVPSSGDVPTAESYSGFGLPVRVETMDLTPKRLREIEADVWDVIEQQARSEGHQFGGYFDAETGKLALHGSAPRSVVAELLDKYPGRVSYEQVEPSSRQGRHNDASPHSGGARIFNIDASAACTSGFTVERSDGTKKITTAGHCGAIGDDFEGGTGNA